MERYIAFLRAINVGGHVVKMAALRALFEELGLANVETFIASGNVIFDAPGGGAAQLEAQIERHLRQALGYAVATFIRTAGELAAIAAYRPFEAADMDAPDASLYVSFLAAQPPATAQQKMQALRTEFDHFHFHEREFHWLSRRKLSESTLSGAVFEKTLGMPATMRNATTVRRLAAKYPA
jgi:uncharacterized protein (DUF1697 family)